MTKYIMANIWDRNPGRSLAGMKNPNDHTEQTKPNAKKDIIFQ